MPPGVSADARPRLAFDPQAYLQRTFKSKGIGTWHELYLEFLESQPDLEVLVIGAGTPEPIAAAMLNGRSHLMSGPTTGRASRRWRQHSLSPLSRRIRSTTWASSTSSSARMSWKICPNHGSRLPEWPRDRGPPLPFSHMSPKEFRFDHVIRVILGRIDAPLFHGGCNDWNDPHLRRFIERFPATEFEHLVGSSWPP